MKVIQTIKEMKREISLAKKTGKSIGFVPTMGFLHEGHLSLLTEARKKHDLVVLSIFVNPLQFGPNEDFERYPRDIERDEQLAKENGVDLLFTPTVEEMYPNEMPMSIQVQQGVDVLCGQSRPGHFDGVATVVMKLFNIVSPDAAFFGQKDAQQVAVIMNMVHTFNMSLEIVMCPTVREEDGLAKSSRNVYLSSDERKEAPILYNTLRYGVELINEGERNRQIVLDKMKNKLELGSGTLDYLEILSYPSLKKEELDGLIILAIAYKYKNARLIDNYTMNVEN